MAVPAQDSHAVGRWWPGAVTALTLAGIGVLHAVWAVSPWPLPDRETMARVVVGVTEDRAPAPLLSLVVAGLLAAAAYLVAAGAEWSPRVGPAWVHRWGVRVVAGVLLVRGISGFVLSGTELAGGLDRATPLDYLHADLALYSPLTLILGTGAALVALRRGRAR
ncbi:MAG: DUF3995 domain-containing protein [Kineosporiaceae bacterium]